MSGRPCWKAAWILVGALLFASGCVNAAERPFFGDFITETHVLYPLQVGDWKAQGEHRYEDQASGVSVHYRDDARPGRGLDLYFYPAGKLDEEGLRKHIDALRSGLLSPESRPDSYEAVEAGALERFELQTGSGKQRERLPAYLIPIQMTVKGKNYTSMLAMLVKDMYFVKVRYSAPAEETSPRQMRKQTRDFLKALVPRNRIVSTGACWDPLPLVVRNDLDANAEGVVMSSTVDGRVVAVAFADRVEMVEDELITGELMQMLASLHTGRIADPSCVAPGNINLPVDEGLREIRMEYRVPPTETDATQAEDG